MIGSFKGDSAKRIFYYQNVTFLPPTIQKRVLRKLLMINAAEILKDLIIPPGNRLERLRGKKEGLYSIRVNDQWRIVFLWKNNKAYDIEIVDYH